MNIVCLSGLLCDSALWQFQQVEFADRANFYFPDLTGSDDIVELTQQVIEGLPEKFTLMALSMGGYVALEIMRQIPDRVEKLILIDTSAREDTPEQKRRRRGLISLAKMGKFKGVTPRLLPLLIHPSRLEEFELPQTIMDMAERVGREGFLNQQSAILSRPDSRETLPAIKCPTLVVCGREDAISPIENHKEMAEGVQDGRLEIVDECGHLAPLERPDQVNILLEEFLFA